MPNAISVEEHEIKSIFPSYLSSEVKHVMTELLSMTEEELLRKAQHTQDSTYPDHLRIKFIPTQNERIAIKNKVILLTELIHMMMTTVENNQLNSTHDGINDVHPSIACFVIVRK